MGRGGGDIPRLAWLFGPGFPRAARLLGAQLRRSKRRGTASGDLKAALSWTTPAEEIEARVELEVKRLAPQVRMPGFRPGKVPPNLIRKMHGESLRGDALNGAVQEGVQQLLSEQNI